MRLAWLLLCGAALTELWAAPTFRLRLPEVSGRWFESGGNLRIPKKPVREIEIEFLGRGFDRVDAGKLHVLVDGNPAEVRASTSKTATNLRAVAIPEEEFFGGEGRHEVEVYVSDSPMRQKWLVTPAAGPTLTENSGPDKGTPLRIILASGAETPTLWSGEQAGEVTITGVVKPAERLTKVLIGGQEQPIDTTLPEMRFSAKIAITRESRDIPLEAFDAAGNYTRVLVPVFLQGKAK